MGDQDYFRERWVDFRKGGGGIGGTLRTGGGTGRTLRTGWGTLRTGGGTGGL